MIETATRNADLREILTHRRREMETDVRGRIRDGRADRSSEGGDDVEHSHSDIQEDIELSLLAMRSEVVARIDEALIRLDAGKYGSCVECEGEISERRLRALPFAVRCQPCAEKREQGERRARQLEERPGGASRYALWTGA